MRKLLLLGEYWNDEEEESGQSFEGKTGWLAKQLLSQVGIDIKQCEKLSVINRRASEYSILKPKAEGIAPVFQKSKYVSKEFAPDIEATKATITKLQPNIILGCGALTAWFLLHSSTIKSIRGAISQSLVGPKCVITYSMSDVFRDWTLRPIVLSDMHKAGREAVMAEISRPSRFITIRPTLNDLAAFEKDEIDNADILSIDIETLGDQITCIGFATSANRAIVIPFYTTQGNYWLSDFDENCAWTYVKRWCLKPAVFQNGLYDIQFLWRRYGIAVPNAVEDTMLLHHAMQPEMQKGLGFLGSLYTDEASWKFMRKAKHD